MSPTEITAGIIGAFIGLPVGHYTVLRRVRREAVAAQLRQARVDDINTRRTQAVPPVIDDEPGINRSWHDDCELIWNLTERTEENR